MAATSAPVRLTELVSCGGCAAKYSAALLQDLVATLAPQVDENLLVGLAPADDAAVYRLDDERALVFTLDFFPPIVDDPATFGAIAATNALSDVFAMGGTPLVALSIAAFPESLPGDAVSAILEGAAAKVREAGGVLAGGHTLRDEEPLYGLAVVGTVHPDRIWTKAGARPGDTLYLTKPLGTGLLVHAKADLTEAIRWMTTLNTVPLEAPHAVTDVTGFGLLGHAHEMASRSGVEIVLDSAALPIMPGALKLAASGVRTGGDPRNRAYVGDALTVQGVDDAFVTLAFDPQTAGGLLIATDAELPFTRIGRVEAGSGVRLI
ncbi:MAG: selenide, water dikinase SelD [Actinobacteria bacterium]|nr:selenide, water dikinase SelD [Actinomycetota bacterium]MBV8395794.1 selenide, water dikinase SelD [Actinomycetota bacterium]